MTTPHRAHHAGSRRASTPRSTAGRDVALFAIGTLVALAAWIYLVHAAIHFGSSARGGKHAGAIALMALSVVGAIACLFIGLMLLTELIRLFSRGGRGSTPPSTGGKRAAR